MINSVLFYALGLVIPTIALLYSFGHFIYQIGEYKENNKTFPTFLLLLIFNLFVISIVVLDIYHVLMYNVVFKPSLVISVLCWSFLVVFDSFTLKSFANHIGNIDDFIESIRPLIYKWRYLYVLKLFVIFCLCISLVTGIFENEFNLLYWFVVIYLYSSWHIVKYIKNINDKFDLKNKS